MESGRPLNTADWTLLPHAAAQGPAIVRGRERHRIMMNMHRRWLLLLLSAATLHGQNIRTGPAVGQPVPDFSLQDQNGRTQTLKSVSGPKGTMLVFIRSADW